MCIASAVCAIMKVLNAYYTHWQHAALKVQVNNLCPVNFNIAFRVSCYNVLIQTNYSIMPLSASGSYMLMIVMWYCGVDILLWMIIWIQFASFPSCCAANIISRASRKSQNSAQSLTLYNNSGIIQQLGKEANWIHIITNNVIQSKISTPQYHITIISI